MMDINVDKPSDSSDTDEKVSFEEALNKTGFGFYSIQLTLLSGLIVIAFVCVAYGSTIIIPASACELNTTVTQQGALAAAPVVGLIIGGIIWGLLADTYGRKRMLVPCIVLSTIFNLIASLSVNWIMLLVFQFIASFMSAGKNTLSLTLIAECIPLARRNVVQLIVASIFLLSQGIMAVLAIPVIPLTFSYYLPSLGIYWNSWRTLILIYSLPNIVCLLWLLAIEESPKFLLMKGRQDEALGVLKKIYRMNHCFKGNLNVKSLISEQTEKKQKFIIAPLFKSPLLRYTLLIGVIFMSKQVGSFLIWLPTIANQYVKVIQTGEGMDSNVCGVLGTALEEIHENSDIAPCAIDRSALLIVFGVACAQSIVNLVICAVVDKVGRRNMSVIVAVVCGLSGIIVNLVPNAIGSAVFFGIFAIGIINVGLHNMIALAIFPTHVRATALALLVTVGRLVTFFSVQILNFLLVINCELGFYSFAAIFTLTALVAVFLPDDRKTDKMLLLKEDNIQSTNNNIEDNAEVNKEKSTNL